MKGFALYSYGEGCQTIVDSKLYEMNRYNGIRILDLNDFNVDVITDGNLYILLILIGTRYKGYGLSHCMHSW